MTLELNSHESVWRAVGVMMPRSDGDSTSEQTDAVLAVKELVNMDEIKFHSHAVSDTPGVILGKWNSSVWTLIASRTHSRLKN